MGAKWNGKERERHFTEPETGTFWSWTWMEFYVCCDCGTIVEFEVGAKMCRAFCCVWSGVLHASINTTRTTAYTRETKRGKEREQSQRWSVWLDSRHFRANLRAVDDFERKIKRTVRFQFEIVWSWKPNMNLLEQKPNSTHNNTRSTNKQTNKCNHIHKYVSIFHCFNATHKHILVSIDKTASIVEWKHWMNWAHVYLRVPPPERLLPSETVCSLHVERWKVKWHFPF